MASDTVTIQLPPDASPELIGRLRDAFPEALVAPEVPADAVETVAATEEALASALLAAPRLGEALAAWWAGLPGGGLWVLSAIVAAALGGYAVERLVRAAFPAVSTAPEPDFRRRAVRGLVWLGGRLLGLVVFAVAATVIWRLLTPADPALRDFARGVMLGVVRARFTYALICALSAPGAPGRRLMGFDEAEAGTVRRAAAWTTAALLALVIPQQMLAAAVGVAPEAALAKLAVFALAAIAGAGFFAVAAAPVRALLGRALAAAPAEKPAWAHGLARRWHWVYFAALALDLLLKALGVLGLLGPQAARGAGPAMLVLFVAPLAVAALRVWRAEDDPKARNGARLGLFALVEGAVIVTAGLLLLLAWGVDPYGKASATGLARLLPGLVEAAVIVAAGFALWRAAAALLQAKRAAAADDAEAGGEEGGGAKGTRLDTILPVLRGFALALIGVTTLFMALSALGVNIAPLLASAGVLGLAIGFGAQRMVADVISGLLYLYEDAFRVGEYIEVSGGKGVVERISIRSVRLRHPRGPVFTIPFSSMGTVQNHSRDWATMKFSFMVPSDTDVEVVRKLVKKVGEQLMSDPELQGKILVPLKSQGAIAITGAAFTIGIKFTAVPGEQFAIRRRAFAALQKALTEKGIELYRPELTLADADPATPQPAPA